MRVVTLALIALLALAVGAGAASSADAAGDDRLAGRDTPCHSPQIDILSTSSGLDGGDVFLQIAFAAGSPGMVCEGTAVEDSGGGTFVQFFTRCFPGDMGFFLHSYVNDPTYGTRGSSFCFPDGDRAYGVGTMSYEAGVVGWRAPVTGIAESFDYPEGRPYDLREITNPWEVHAVDPLLVSGFTDDAFAGPLGFR